MEITKSKRTKSKDRLKANGSISTRTISLFLNRETEIEEIYPLTQDKGFSPPLPDLVNELNKKIHGLGEQIKMLGVHLQSGHDQLADRKMLLIPDKQGCDFIYEEDLICCKGDGNYVRLFFKDGTSKVSSQSLMDVFAKLDPLHFCKTHQSWVVNKREIKRFQSNDSLVITKLEQTIPVARSMMASVKSHLCLD